jgi:hypothetical protein
MGMDKHGFFTRAARPVLSPAPGVTGRRPATRHRANLSVFIGVHLWLNFPA